MVNVPSMPQLDSLHAPASSAVPKRKSHDRKRAPGYIKRPPNAFVLYRSDFFHRRIIPPDVESKQQNISRVVGQCWRRLSSGEKNIWFALADQKGFEHEKKYPGYKFKPVTRDNVQRRRQASTREEQAEHCNRILHTYLPHMGSVVPKSSPRRPRQKRKSRAKASSPLSYSESDHPVFVAQPPSSLPDSGPAFTGPLIRAPSPNHSLEALAPNSEITNEFPPPDNTWMSRLQKDPKTVEPLAYPVPISLVSEDGMVEEQQRIEESVISALPSQETQSQHLPQQQSAAMQIFQNFHRDLQSGEFNKKFPPKCEDPRATFNRPKSFFVSPQNKPQPRSSIQCSTKDESHTADMFYPNDPVSISADNYFVNSIFRSREEQAYPTASAGMTLSQCFPMTVYLDHTPQCLPLHPSVFSSEAVSRFNSEDNAVVFPSALLTEPLLNDTNDTLRVDGPLPDDCMAQDPGVPFQETSINELHVNPSGDDLPLSAFMLSDPEMPPQEPSISGPCINPFVDGLPLSSFPLWGPGVSVQEPLFDDPRVDLPVNGLPPNPPMFLGLEIASPPDNLSFDSTTGWPTDESWGLLDIDKQAFIL